MRTHYEELLKSQKAQLQNLSLAQTKQTASLEQTNAELIDKVQLIQQAKTSL